MKTLDLNELGLPRGPILGRVKQAWRQAADPDALLAEVRAAVADAEGSRRAEGLQGEVARAVLAGCRAVFTEREAPAPFEQWGKGLDEASLEQMRHACRLPIAVRGAVMPDAHRGYGLPIGGVLATRGAVIPYAVGVDIACRVKMTVLDLPVSHARRSRGPAHRSDRVGNALRHRRQASEVVGSTRSWTGTGRSRRSRRSSRTRPGRSSARAAAATTSSSSASSSSSPPRRRPTFGLEAGVTYLALLSHSGSRGRGCGRRRPLQQEGDGESPRASARAEAPGVARPRRRRGRGVLAGDDPDGALRRGQPRLHPSLEIARHLGAEVALDVENHHNFAWKEIHDGEEVVVHRKGATPAGEGALGSHPGLHGRSGLPRARQGRSRLAVFGQPRCRSRDEPHPGEEDARLGHGESTARPSDASGA